jgi:hypothetical protein
MEIIFLSNYYYFIFIIPLICFGKNKMENDTVWNVINSKEHMYIASRKAFQKIVLIDKTLKRVRHSATFKFRKSKIFKILSTTSHGYNIIKTGRLRFRIGDLKLYYNFRNNKYRLKYSFRF